jgi:Novel STAND NTPase 1
MNEAEAVSIQPYIGPRPFETDDSDLFFGRDREAYEISSLILANRFFVLYAASGAGKTSLFNAGIRPLLKDDLEILPTVRFQGPVPDSIPESSNVYTYAALSTWSDRQGVGKLADTRLGEFLQGRPRKFAGPLDTPLPHLLVFDQFEELFTTHPDRWPQRLQFLEQLDEAGNLDPSLRVLIVIREDFLARLLSFADTLFDGLKDRYFLEGLRESAAEIAVKGPLQDSGRFFEPDAIGELVRRLMTTRIEIGDQGIKEIPGEFAEPLLLQVVCQTLWKRLPPDTSAITLRNIEDVDTSLARFYSGIVKEAAKGFNLPELQIREWMEQKLITPGGTRGTVYVGPETTEGLPNGVVNFLDGKLLRAEYRAGARWLEITHDSLLRPIDRSNTEFFRSRNADLDRLPKLPSWVAVVLAGLTTLTGAVIGLLTTFTPVHWTSAQTTLVATEVAAFWVFAGAVTAHLWPGTKKQPVAVAGTFTAFVSSTLCLAIGFTWWQLKQSDNAALISLVTAIVAVVSALVARRTVRAMSLGNTEFQWSLDSPNGRLPMPPRVTALLAALTVLTEAVIFLLASFNVVYWVLAETTLVVIEAAAFWALVGAVTAHLWPGAKAQPVAIAGTVTAFVSSTLSLGMGFYWWQLTQVQNASLIGLVTAIVAVTSALAARSTVVAGITPSR